MDTLAKPGVRRDNQLNIHLSDEELGAIDEESMLAGEARSSYARAILMAHIVRSRQGRRS